MTDDPENEGTAYGCRDCRDYLGRLAKERQAILAREPDKKAVKVANKISGIKALIVPPLANGITHLIEEDMERFAGSHTVDGKAPKPSTIGNLNSAWLELLSDAVSLG